MAAPEEKTFKSYTPTQGATYASSRPGYHPSLYTLIITHHTSTGGSLDALLDVGCGPGTSTFALAPNFKNVIGIDASEGMIAAARSLIPTSTLLPNSTTLGSEAKETPNIRFEISSSDLLGNNLNPAIANQSIDLITASTAAHWFNMSLFWPRAAQVLKPGGTVAFWGGGGHPRIHPSVPNAVKIQAMFDDLEENELQPFFEPGNVITRELYKTMAVPWDLNATEGMEMFEKESFFRKEWDVGHAEEFYEGSRMEADLDTLEKIQGTLSPVQRWREANPDKVGTEKDVVRRMRRGVEKLLWEAGVERGQERIKGSLDGVLIMVKKRL